MTENNKASPGSSDSKRVGKHQNRDGNCWWCGGKTYEDFHGGFESVRAPCRCCNGTNIAAKGFNEFLGIGEKAHV